MIVRLISSIVALVIIAFFAGFNLENKCDVNLLFYTFKDAPVFLPLCFLLLPALFLQFRLRSFSAQKRKETERLKKILPGMQRVGAVLEKSLEKVFFHALTVRKAKKNLPRMMT